MCSVGTLCRCLDAVHMVSSHRSECRSKVEFWKLFRSLVQRVAWDGHILRSVPKWKEKWTMDSSWTPVCLISIRRPMKSRCRMMNVWRIYRLLNSFDRSNCRMVNRNKTVSIADYSRCVHCVWQVIKWFVSAHKWIGIFWSVTVDSHRKLLKSWRKCRNRFVYKNWHGHHSWMINQPSSSIQAIIWRIWCICPSFPLTST